MFYKELEHEKTNMTEKFDWWLATLPKPSQQRIFASKVAHQLAIEQTDAQKLLDLAESKQILKKYFLITCPHCGKILREIKQDQLAEVLAHPISCSQCGKITVHLEYIYVAYQVAARTGRSQLKENRGTVMVPFRDYLQQILG